MHRQLQLFAHRPHRVVAVARVRLVVAPPRRDDDAAGEAVGVRAAGSRRSRRRGRRGSGRRSGRRGAPGCPGTARPPSGCRRARRRAGGRGPWVATGLNPAPNGAPMVPVAASGPGNTTSPATPSLSSSLSRVAASQPPRRPISWRLLPSSSSPNHSSLNSSSPMKCDPRRRPRRASMRALALGELLVEVVEVLGVEVVAVHGRVRAGVAVGRDHDVVLHRGIPLGALGRPVSLPQPF